MRLADIFLEGSRTHPLGKGRCRVDRTFIARRFSLIEEIGHGGNLGRSEASRQTFPVLAPERYISMAA